MANGKTGCSKYLPQSFFHLLLLFNSFLDLIRPYPEIRFFLFGEKIFFSKKKKKSRKTTNSSYIFLHLLSSSHLHLPLESFIARDLFKGKS